MERAIFSGDSQVELYKSMDMLISDVEYWILEQTPCRAFLEDGTEYELYVAKGAHIKYPFIKKTRWVSDFLHTDAKILSAPPGKSDELTQILKEGLLKSNKLSDVEQEIDHSLEDILQIFEERLGYSK